jgi:hypothetical protein
MDSIGSVVVGTDVEGHVFDNVFGMLTSNIFRSRRETARLLVVTVTENPHHAAESRGVARLKRNLRK